METHATGEAVEGLEQAEFMGKERKEGRESSRSPGRTLTGLRVGRDSWWMFTGQEISLSL